MSKSPGVNGSSESLTWDQERAWRLSQHRLDRRVRKTAMLDVVRQVCGLHAQVQSSAELQVWSRVNGASPGDVRAALWEERSLVRTWCMRGTLHLLTGEDLALYVSALRQHDRWWKGAWLRMIGMTEPELRAVLEAIRDSLGAKPLAREQLAEKVAARVGAKGRDRMMSGWGEMLKPAAFHGYLCSGPPRGQSVTFVRPDRWLGELVLLSTDDAWREIVRRYLHAYGPASREEFARWWGMQPAPAGRVMKALGGELSEVDRWWGMQPAPAGRVMKALGGELSEVDVEGHSAWVLAEDVAEVQRFPPRTSVRLLAGFDVYTAGTRPRASLVDPRFEDLVFRKAGWISPVVLVNGYITGVWKHEHRGKRIDVLVSPFQSLSADHRKAIANEADRLGKFLDAPAVVSFSAPTE